jgi:hypothetical protein
MPPLTAIRRKETSRQGSAPSFGDEPHIFIELRDGFSETNLGDAPKFKQPDSP